MGLSVFAKVRLNSLAFALHSESMRARVQRAVSFRGQNQHETRLDWGQDLLSALDCGREAVSVVCSQAQCSSMIELLIGR